MVDDKPQAVAVVPVQSGWLSKINWTQIVQGVAMVLVFVSGNKINLTPDQQAAIVVVIGVVGNIVTVLFRQFGTNTVTKQSLAPEQITVVKP